MTSRWVVDSCVRPLSKISVLCRFSIGLQSSDRFEHENRGVERGGCGKRLAIVGHGKQRSRSPQELIAAQSDLFRDNLEGFLQGSRRVAEASVRVADHATDLPFGTLARLAQNEERRCAGGEAGGRRGLGQGEMADERSGAEAMLRDMRLQRSGMAFSILVRSIAPGCPDCAPK
jgi:hypothetical protein